MADKTERIHLRTDIVHLSKLELLAQLANVDRTGIIELLVDLAYEDTVKCGLAPAVPPEANPSDAAMLAAALGQAPIAPQPAAGG